MTGEFDYFPLAAVVDRLGQAAKERSKAEFVSAIKMLDTTPALILRGVAYLSLCLEEKAEKDERQALIARSALNEMTALCAALLDLECDAGVYEALALDGEVKS